MPEVMEPKVRGRWQRCELCSTGGRAWTATQLNTASVDAAITAMRALVEQRTTWSRPALKPLPATCFQSHDTGAAVAEPLVMMQRISTISFTSYQLFDGGHATST
jgi:hypothetical protein